MYAVAETMDGQAALGAMYASPDALPTMEQMAAAASGGGGGGGGSSGGGGSGLEAEYMMQSVQGASNDMYAVPSQLPNVAGGASALYAVTEPSAPTESVYMMQDVVDDGNGL